MFKYVFVFLLLEVSFSFLKVYSPTCATSRLPNNIQYTLSNFGQIPYGQTIIGQIRLPNDLQLCSTQGQVQKTKIPSSNTKDILLVKRGKCKFTQKVINAQNLGSDVIIIYDNVEGPYPQIFMKNDGHGHLAQIPSLFISNDDGMKLLSAIKECFEPMVLKIEFEIDQKQKSQVTLWLDANNRETYILAREFYENDYFEVIKDRIDLSMRFRIDDTCDEWICKEDDCAYSSLLIKYCRNVKSDNPTINSPKGINIINQQLREYFMWQQLKGTGQQIKWWRYMTKFDHQVCIEAADIEECSYVAMKNAQISNKIISSIKYKVQQTIKNPQFGKDNILKQSYDESKELGIFFYPQATINNRNFYGLFKAPEVFETICNSLINPPTECIMFIKKNHNVIVQPQDSSIAKTIITIILLMGLGFIIALVLYTNMIRKQVNQQLSVQVNKMVENYVTFNKKESANSYNKFDT